MSSKSLSLASLEDPSWPLALEATVPVYLTLRTQLVSANGLDQYRILISNPFDTNHACLCLIAALSGWKAIRRLRLLSRWRRWKIACFTMSKLKDFEFLSVLGKGSFGTVHHVRRRVDGNSYVMKQIPIASLDAKAQQDSINEVQILASLDSPFVVKYYDSFLAENTLNIVMEYCSNGDLGRRIKEQRGKLIPEQDVWRFFIQCVPDLCPATLCGG